MKQSVFCCALLLQLALVGAIRNSDDILFDDALVEGEPASAAQVEDEPEKTPFTHWFSRHNIPIDAARQAQKMREVSADGWTGTEDGILQADETVDFAFKVGSVKTFFTNKRMILRWRKLFSPRREWKSIPYSSIKAWSVETNGRWPDMATRLRVWTSAPGALPIWRAFRKGKVDIFELGRYLGAKTGIPMAQDQVPMSSEEFKYVAEDFWSWWGGDHVQVEPAAVEEKLRRMAPILGSDEAVQQAFKLGAELFLFTTHRVISAQVMGIVWQRSIRFRSIPWRWVQAYEIRTAGGLLDHDSELSLYTDIPDLRRVRVDLRSRRVNTEGILSFLAEKLMPPSVGDQTTTSRPTVAPQMSFRDILAWLGNDFSQVDPAEADAIIRAGNPGLFMDDEFVELGYRVWKDSFLLTNKRVLLVKVNPFQLFTAPKVTYTSVPYSAIRSFSTTSSGWFDLDSEFTMYTSIPVVSESDDGTVYGHGRMRIDMRRGRANITELQEHMAAKLYGAPEANTPPCVGEVVKQRDSFLDWLLGWSPSDSREIDAGEAQQEFCQQGILQPDEVVELAFRLRLDTTLYTAKRLIVVNVNVLNKNRVTVRSLPYSSIRSFYARVAGPCFSCRDHDLHLYTDIPSFKYVHHEFHKNQVDIFKIQEALAARVGGTGLPQSLFQASARAFVGQGDEGHDEADEPRSSDSLAQVGVGPNLANFHEILAEVAEQLLHPILQDGEDVVMAFMYWNDMLVLTQRRILFRRVMPSVMPLAQVRYLTIPFSSVEIFHIQTGGTLDGSMEMSVFLDQPGQSSFSISFKRNLADIFKVGKYLNDHILGEVESV